MKPTRPTPRGAIRRIYALLGIQQGVSPREILISAITAALAMAALYAISHAALGESDAPLMIASMGSSAILVFAVPHGAFSQPWAVLAGHTVSALAGVLSAMLIPSLEWACAVAVASSIAASLLLRCLHPSGGGTALVPVLGGEGVQALGFSFVLVPVLLNAAILVLLGIVLNALFHWRRYPATLTWPSAATGGVAGPGTIDREDLRYALQGIETSVEITEPELSVLVNRAVEHALLDQVGSADVHPGHDYANVWFGTDMEIRTVLSVEQADGTSMVRYRSSMTGEVRVDSLGNFALWARRQANQSICRESLQTQQMSGQVSKDIHCID